MRQVRRDGIVAEEIPAPLVAVWDEDGRLEFVPATLRGLTMVDAVELEDATRRAVDRIAADCEAGAKPPVK